MRHDMNIRNLLCFNHWSDNMETNEGINLMSNRLNYLNNLCISARLRDEEKA